MRKRTEPKTTRQLMTRQGVLLPYTEQLARRSDLFVVDVDENGATKVVPSKVNASQPPQVNLDSPPAAPAPSRAARAAELPE